MRKWLSGRASPCQGEGREFESRLPLQTTTDVHTSVLLYMNDQLSWIERLATDQKVGGSNPLSFAKTIATIMIAIVFFYFLIIQYIPIQINQLNAIPNYFQNNHKYLISLNKILKKFANDTIFFALSNKLYQKITIYNLLIITFP